MLVYETGGFGNYQRRRRAVINLTLICYWRDKGSRLTISELGVRESWGEGALRRESKYKQTKVVSTAGAAAAGRNSFSKEHGEE